MKILSSGKYYGSKKSEIGFNGIILSEYDYHASRTDWHFHENPYFMYILQGNLFDINKKEKTHCESGSLVFHNWQEAHYNTKETSHARGFHIEFNRMWFEEKKIDINLWEGSQLIKHPKLYHLIWKLYSEFNYQDQFSEISIELLLLQLCENMEVAHNALINEPSWVQSLKQILHEDIENQDLKSLSEMLGVHPVHISRATAKYLNCSLGDYIRQQKIKKSLDMMKHTNYSLTEIALQCGFSDQSHFIRVFKSFFNQTPSAFRRLVI